MLTSPCEGVDVRIDRPHAVWGIPTTMCLTPDESVMTAHSERGEREGEKMEVCLVNILQYTSVKRNVHGQHNVTLCVALKYYKYVRRRRDCQPASVSRECPLPEQLLVAEEISLEIYAPC